MTRGWMAIVFGSLCGWVRAVDVAPVLLDLGPADSAVWEGFRPLAPSRLATSSNELGWLSTNGLTAIVQRWDRAVTNVSRQRAEPPPIWTSPITEDAILSTSPATLSVPLPPGEYEVCVIAGSSLPKHRAWVFDYDVCTSDATQRVIVAGSYDFRFVRFRTNVAGGTLQLEFLPRNCWIANAVMVYPAEAAATVEREVLEPIQEWTFGLPPFERERWNEDPLPPPGETIAPTPEELARGFRLWTRHWAEPIYPNTEARAEEILAPLRLFATPGEYEPVTFVVRSYRALNRLEISVSDIGPIRSSDVEVRRVGFMRARPNYNVSGRFRWVPDVLHRWAPGPMASNENVRIWLTVRIPSNAPAGLYTGHVRVTGDGQSVNLPIRLRVLPFRLREPTDRLFAIYYHHPLDRAAEAPDEWSRAYWRRKADLEHADMVAHGTRNVVLHVNASPSDERGEFRIEWNRLAEKFELWTRHGFRGPVVMSFPLEAIYRKYMKSGLGAHLRAVQLPPEEVWREATALVRAIEAGRRQRGWPEFLYYPVDEPGPEPTSVQFMVRALQACRQAGVRTYVTADPMTDVYAPMRPWVDVWCYQRFNVPIEQILNDRVRGIEYWCYPNHIAGENDHTPVGGARLTYGFAFWASHYRALIPWIYQALCGNPWNYLDGPYMDFMVRSEPDGTPVPVALWEAYREGYDDFRYIATLEAAIAAARTTGRPDALQVVARAEADLSTMRAALPGWTHYKDQVPWGPEEFDARRWTIAVRVMELANFVSLEEPGHPPSTGSSR